MGRRQLKFDQLSGDPSLPTGYVSIITPIKLENKRSFRYLLGCPLKDFFENNKTFNSLIPIVFDDLEEEGYDINFCILRHTYDSDFIKKIKHLEGLDVFLLRNYVQLKNESELSSLDSTLGVVFHQYMQTYDSFLESMTKNSEDIIFENPAIGNNDVTPIDFKFRMKDIPGWNLN